MILGARRNGWASAPGTLSDVTQHASKMGLIQVPNRRGETPVSVLRPTTEESAHPSSLSARYGLGAQPLHTDGAHHLAPPDVLVFVAEKPNATPTWLRSVVRVAGSRAPWPDLKGGMFLVGTGPTSFFAPAWDDTRGLRFDPGCMTPCDSRARVAAAFLADAGEAVPHNWSEERHVLVVDNTRALHGRGAVAEDDEDRELIRIAYRKAHS